MIRLNLDGIRRQATTGTAVLCFTCKQNLGLLDVSKGQRRPRSDRKPHERRRRIGYLAMLLNEFHLRQETGVEKGNRARGNILRTL